MRILTVCTANICRSPVAQAVLRREAAQRGLTDVEVASAGLLPGGRRVDATMADVAAQAGLDVDDHVSTQLTAELLDVDLVVTMTRAHTREAVLAHRPAWPRTFTLKEAVRRSRQVGPRRDDEALDGWLERLATGRSSRDLLGDDPADDVLDPHRAPRPVYEAIVAEIDEQGRGLAGALWGP